MSALLRSARHPALLAVSLLLAPALWILFVASTNAHEMVVGVPACFATLLFSWFVCRHSPISVSLHARDLLQCWRIPWYVLSGAVQVTGILVKDLFGIAPAADLYSVCGFDTSKHDPVRIARTVLAVAYTSASPTSIVIGIDQSQSRMIFHQIANGQVPRMAQNLGAKS